MKYLKIFLITILFIFPSILSFSQENSFDDFRGLEWGEFQNGDKIKINGVSTDLIFQKKKDGKIYYNIENDNLTIGTVELDMIYYVFNYKGQFCGLEIEGKPEDYPAEDLVDEGIQPDVIVKQSLEAYLNDEDEVLNQVRTMMEEK